jgi:hypothetical protein
VNAMIMFTALALLGFGWLAMLVLKSSSQGLQAQAITRQLADARTPAPTRPWWRTAGRVKP